MRNKTGRAKAGKYRGVVGIFAAVLMCILFQKGVPVRAAGVSGYIFPDSAQRYMSEEELYDLPLQIINYGKNEIYARHGRRFRSQELQAYFDGQSWYSGSISPDDFDENSLNEYERTNAHMINDFEHQYNAEGYKLDQGGYSYETVYAYLTQAEENTWDGENEGGNGDFEEGGSVDFGAADGASDTEDTVLEDGTVQHKSLYGTVTFKLEYQDGGQSLYGVIRALDSSGAVLWKRSTDSYMCAGYAQVTDLGIHGNRYYYEEGGTIVAIRIADGAILWKSVQALGAPRCCFGAGDMIYLCGYYGPDFVALDRTGEALQYINSLDADFAYTTAIRYENGIVYITKDGSESGQAAKTFSIDVSWMEPEQTEENGKETERKEENQAAEKNGAEEGQPANQENGEKEEELLTEDNVKTESQQEEIVTYDDWIRLNMVPTLGVCDNGTFANIVSNNDYGNWLEQTGIVSRYEADLDGDGATEALVIYLNEENSFVNLHAAVLKKQSDGIKITQDMDCMKIWGMAEDTQFFTFEQTGRKHFVLQSFCQFNGISERLTIFHVTEEGKIEADCIISDPGYTSGLALQKIEGEWNGGRMYSEKDYENTKDLYSYDGMDELMDCAENPAYGEAFNGQIQPYGLEATVSETAFHTSRWRVKEDDLTELCRVYATSESMGTTTDGVLVYQYIYAIYDNTGVKENCDYDQEAGARLAEIAAIEKEEATENDSQENGKTESSEGLSVYTGYLEETWLDRDVTCAAADVDNDGAEELLIRYDNSDANCEIYKADAASGEVRYIGQIAYVHYDLYWSEKYGELVQFSRSAGSETYSFYRFDSGTPEFDFGVSWTEVNNVDKRITGYSYFSDNDRHELGRYEVAQAEEEDPQAKAEASKEYRAYLEDMVQIEFSPVLDFIWKNESASR